jgi:hypothetical protein
MARADECKNFMVNGRCDSWIISKFRSNDFIAIQDYSGGTDSELIEEICLQCPNFRKESNIIWDRGRSSYLYFQGKR